MIKVSKALENSDTEVLKKINDLIGNADQEISALTLYLWCYRLGKYAEALRKNILADANEEYIEHVKPDESNRTTEKYTPVPFAVVQANTFPATWVYPEDIIRQEAELKAAKEEAKRNHTAKKVSREVDKTRDQLFKVQLVVE